MRYQWSAIDREGELVHGIELAVCAMEVRHKLKISHLVPIEVRKCDMPKLTAKERKRLLEQLAMLLGANMPLLQALEFMAEDNTTKRSKQLLQLGARRVLLDGDALSTVFKELGIVSELQYQLIRAGEVTGKLSVVLQQLVAELNADEQRRKKLRKLLSYPVTLLSVALLVVGIFLHWILPQFAELFSSMRLELPLVTRWILKSTGLIKQKGAMVGVMMVGLGTVAGFCYQRSSVVRYHLDRQLLRCPWIGRIVVYRAMQQIFTTLTLLLSAGIHLVPALALLKNLLTNSGYQRAIGQVRDEVINGLEFYQALRNTALFEAATLQFIMLGERSGQLVAITKQLGDYYAKSFTELLDSLGQRLEPTIILLLGVVIGVLVLGMYLPIFQLGEVVH